MSRRKISAITASSPLATLASPSITDMGRLTVDSTGSFESFIRCLTPRIVPALLAGSAAPTYRAARGVGREPVRASPVRCPPEHGRSSEGFMCQGCSQVSEAGAWLLMRGETN
eukprot:2495283-Pleurochrysis_carterae.AAC.1